MAVPVCGTESRTMPQVIPMSSLSNALEDEEEGTGISNPGINGKVNAEKRVEMYLPRYHINRKKQGEILEKNAFLSQCIPCCLKSSRVDTATFMADLSRSVALMLILQVLVLTLGVTKEGLDLRGKGYRSTHFIITTIETMMACLLVITQTVFMVTLYRSGVSSTATVFSDAPRRNGYATTDYDTVVRPRQHKMCHLGMPLYMNIYVGFAIGLVFFMLCSYLTFMHVAHHGWTVLSNNACLVLFTAYTAMTQRRLVRNNSQLLLDESKVAISELLLVLREARNAQTEEEKEEAENRADQLQKLLNSSDVTWFRESVYITKDLQSLPT